MNRFSPLLLSKHPPLKPWHTNPGASLCSSAFLRKIFVLWGKCGYPTFKPQTLENMLMLQNGKDNVHYKLLISGKVVVFSNVSFLFASACCVYVCVCVCRRARACVRVLTPMWRSEGDFQESPLCFGGRFSTKHLLTQKVHINEVKTSEFVLFEDSGPCPAIGHRLTSGIWWLYAFQCRKKC